MHTIKHTEVVEGRQRIAKINRLHQDLQMEQIKMQRFEQGLLNARGLEGLKAKVNWDTGEILVTPEQVHFTLLDSVSLCAFQDFFSEIGPSASPPSP